MKKILLIYGPTATGKTKLGINLAKKFNGEIISADSRQVYWGLDIGTGKVSFDSKIEKHKGYWVVKGVKIHGFDLIEPEQSFSAADFLKFSSITMIQILGVKKLPIVVGGTGFYFKALIYGIDTLGIKPDLKFRKQLEKLSVEGLFQKLENLDPQKAGNLNLSDRANPRRLIRAIEIATSNQSPVARDQRRRDWQLATGNYYLVGLTAPNDFLYQRADQWIDTRLNNGMIEEVQKLLDQKIDPIWLDNLGLEYRWITRYLLGKIGKSEMVERLKGDIHNFIRRQKTWFRQFRNIKLFDISQSNWQTKLENDILKLND